MGLSKIDGEVKDRKGQKFLADASARAVICH